MLIRSWNLYHGRTHPPGRVSLLEEAVRLVTDDGPDVVCLQELPIWALEYLDDWSGMVAIGAVTSRRPVGRGLARRLTDLHPGLLRSALTGQANAVLVAPTLRVLGTETVVLNPGRLRERRVAQTVRLDTGLTVANVHADPRHAEEEVLRAAVFLDAIAAPGDVAVLAGDFNLRGGRVLDELAAWGFSAPGPGIDHVLVRGAEAGPLEVWPEERRLVDGLLVSDHAPVEVALS